MVSKTISADINDLSALIYGSFNGLDIEKISGNVMGAEFSASGRLNDFKSPYLYGNINLKNLPVEKIVKTKIVKNLVKDKFKHNLPASGFISADANIYGDFQNPEINCFVSLKNGKFMDFDINDAKLSLNLQKDKIELKQSKISIENCDINLGGWFFPKNQSLLLNGDIFGNPPSFFKDVALGYSNCKFTVCGTVLNPIVYGNASAQNIAVKNIDLGRAKSDFLYDNKTIYASSIKVNSSSGEVNAAAVYDIDKEELSSAISVDNFLIPNISSSVSGNMSGSVSFAGTLKSPLAIADLSLSSCVLSGLKMDHINVPLVMNKDFLKFSLQGSNGYGLSLNAYGGADLLSSKAVNLDFSASGLDFSKYPSLKSYPFLKFESDLKGCLSGSAKTGFMWDIGFLSGKSKASFKGFASGINDPKILSWGDIHNFSIDDSKTAPIILNGTISEGGILASGSLSALNISSFMEFDKMTAAGVPISLFCANGIFEKDKINLKNASLIGDKGSVRFSGNINSKTQDFDLDTWASGLDVNYLLSSVKLNSRTAFDPKDILLMPDWSNLQAVADLKGNLKVTKGKPSLSGTLNIPDGAWDNETLILNSIFSMDSYGAFFKCFELTLGSGIYLGEGNIGFLEDKPINMKVSAKDGDLERLSAFIFRAAGLPPETERLIKNGRFDGELRIAGTMKKPIVNGFVEVENVFVGGQLAKKIVANISTSKDILLLDNFVISFSEGEIRGNGTISRDGILDFTFETFEVPCSCFEPLREWLEGSSGLVSMILKITGTLTDPEISAVVKAESIKFMGQNVDEIDSEFSFKNFVVTVNNMNIKRGEELYSLTGNLNIKDISKIKAALIGFLDGQDHKFEPLDIKCSIRKGSLPFLMSFANLHKKDDYDGEINADFSLSAKENNSELKMSLSVDNGIFMGMPLEKFNINIDKYNTFLKDVMIEIGIPGGNFLMSGKIDGIGEDKIIMESKDFELDIISPFLKIPSKYALSGKCNLKGLIEGKLPLPDISLDFSVDSAKIGDVPAGNIEGRLNTEFGSILKTSLSAINKGQRIRMTGFIPYSMEDGIFKITDSILFQSRINLKNFDLLSLVFPIERESSGSVLGRLDITGRFPDMSLDGKLVVKDGVLTPKALKNPIKAINAEIILKDKNIVLKDVTATMGTGTITIGGQVDFDKTGLTAAELSAKGNDLQISAKTLFSGIMDLDTKFTAENGIRTFSGNASVKNSLISISPTMFSGNKNSSLKDFIPEFLHGTLLDLDTSVKNDVWVAFMSSQAQANGDLKIAGIAEEPLISGNIRLSKGNIVVPVVSTPFKLYYGNLRFDGLGIVPNVTISGDTAFGEHAAHLSITGPLNKPNINIESDIPIGNAYSTGGVIRDNMIYTGHLSHSSMDMAMTGTMNQIAFNSMLEFSVMRPILNQLGRTFGLTDVAVEFRQDGVTAIRLARALDRKERFLLTYESATNIHGQLENLWGVEYRFGRGMVVRIANGSLGNTYVWVQARRKF